MSSSLGMMTDIVEFEGRREGIGHQVTYSKDNNFLQAVKKHQARYMYFIGDKRQHFG